VAAPDLGEQAAVLGTVERIPSDQHGVEHDPEAPHVGGAARVLTVGLQDLRRHVGGAAVLVRQQVVSVVLQHHGVLQGLQLDLGSAIESKVNGEKIY